MPIYERKLVVSLRTDIRLLAGLAEFYKNRNELARTKSSLVGDAIEDFVLFLQSKDKLSVPLTTHEALDILKENNFNFFEKGGTMYQRGIVKGLADEEYDYVKAEAEDVDAQLAKEIGKQLAEK